ncbi:Di-sulfide bridge nucleocytoplasmic transport domain-containing protein [Kalaharituber pfeilii]|nr:Di-sulfide bridge nucleocytoplasmic transport domain-containing protein [Kalaharituber pfeilii]
MERRTNESPMDFEWERKSIPNPNSPFHLGALKNSMHDGSQSFRAQNNFVSPTKPSVFATPSSTQSIFATPSRQLFGGFDTLTRNPNDNPLPTTTPLFQSSSFTNPRTNLFPPSIKKCTEKEPFPTPERHEEDETPDATPTLHGVRMSNSNMEGILSTTTERVSGRGELRRGKFTEASRKRVQKRKQRNLSERDIFGSPKAGSRSEYGDDDENDDTSDEGSMPQVPPLPPKVRAGSKWDHHFPVLASSYLQLFFNLFIVMVVLYLVLSFLRTIQADVDTKVRQTITRRLTQIEDCTQKFKANRCDSEYRVPALEPLCLEWETCMHLDPAEVGRARVSAQTFAEILNSLIEPISYKAMFFCLMLFFGTLVFTNTAFGIYRSKMAAEPPYIPQPPPPPPPTVPPTPVHPVWNPHVPFHVPSHMPSAAPSMYRTIPQMPSTPTRKGQKQLN